MAKGKSSNPADAYRKAQRKKELQKNKDSRKKTRDFANVKRETGPLEEEIQQLEAKPELDGKDKTRLTNLRAELDKLRKAKEEYVKEHPEHRRLVYGGGGSSRPKNDDNEASLRNGPPAERKVFGKDGLPLHPERSIYYDPVMNPYGIPPPGMPYIEKPMPQDDTEMVEQVSDSDADEDDEDEDIVMPEGPPPPNPEEDDSDSEDDDIPLPPGPPPRPPPPLPKGPPPALAGFPGSFGVAPSHFPIHAFPMGPISGAMQLPIPPPPPPLPAGFQTAFTGLPPPPPPGGIPVPPPPPAGFQVHIPAGFSANSVPPPPPPPPPPGIPLAAAPPVFHYQSTPLPAYLILPGYGSGVSQPSSTLPPPPPGLPAKPPAAPLPMSTTATIVAEPELRDFKKEATSFVPRQARRAGPKQPQAPTVDNGSKN